jgi:hypothetical protein
MASPTYAILGQVTPAAATLTAIYTVPIGRKATCRVICANGASPALFRVSVGVGGAADSFPLQYVAIDEPINAGQSLASVPLAVNSGDVIRVQSNTGQAAFTVSGIEQDV